MSFAVVSLLNVIEYPRRPEYTACGTRLHNQILATFHVLAQTGVVWAYTSTHAVLYEDTCWPETHEVVETLAILKHHPHLHPTRHPLHGAYGALWHRK